jgi:hypothetical protein
MSLGRIDVTHHHYKECNHLHAKLASALHNGQQSCTVADIDAQNQSTGEKGTLLDGTLLAGVSGFVYAAAKAACHVISEGLGRRLL